MERGKKIIAITRKIPEAGMKLLENRGFELRVSPHDRVLHRAELLKMTRGADAVVCQLEDDIDAKFFQSAGKQLKVVAQYAVGTDNIDLAAAKKYKVKITNTPGVLTQAVAEHTFALLTAVARRIVESDKFLRGGKYQGWAPELLVGSQLEGKTLGVIGLGRIGSRVAEIAARGYKMKVMYFDKGKRDKKLDEEIGSESVSMRKLLTSSDFVSIHVPLLPSTKHLIGRSELASMKKTAILINTSRGPVVDEKALAQALKSKKIWGAGLDVFEEEPKVNPIIRKLDNAVITPHTASATREARDAMAEIAVKNVIAVLSGNKPLTQVK